MSIEAMKQALEALESWHKGFPENMNDLDDQAITSLRQAIEQAEQAHPVAWTTGFYAGHCVIRAADPAAMLPIGVALYTAPPQRQPLTVEQAHDIGAKGGEPTESERLLFEAWMRGHCWKVCGTWDGKQYRSPTEVNGEVDYHAMHTRQLWAAWRDRAALEAAHGIKGEA